MYMNMQEIARKNSVHRVRTRYVPGFKTKVPPVCPVYIGGWPFRRGGPTRAIRAEEPFEKHVTDYDLGSGQGPLKREHGRPLSRKVGGQSLNYVNKSIHQCTVDQCVLLRLAVRPSIGNDCERFTD